MLVGAGMMKEVRATASGVEGFEVELGRGWVGCVQWGSRRRVECRRSARWAFRKSRLSIALMPEAPLFTSNMYINFTHSHNKVAH